MAVQVILSLHPEQGYVTVQDYEFVDLLRAGLILSYQDPTTGVGVPAVPAVFTQQQRDELSRAFLPKWLPKTAYPVGATIVNPMGQIAIAIVAHTSGTTYDSAKWTLTAVQAQDVADAIVAAIAAQAAIDRGTYVALRGAWTANTAYLKNSLVIQNGIGYLALVDVPARATFTASDWIALGGAAGDLISALTGGGQLSFTGSAATLTGGGQLAFASSSVTSTGGGQLAFAA